MHRVPAAIGDAFKQHLIRGRLSGEDTLSSGVIDGCDVRH
jgi:hypothetical protein